MQSSEHNLLLGGRHKMNAEIINLNRFANHIISSDEFTQFVDGNYAVECKCPKCGVRHKMNIFWTGRGMPRKFCPSCRGVAGGISDDIQALSIHQRVTGTRCA